MFSSREAKADNAITKQRSECKMTQEELLKIIQKAEREQAVGLDLSMSGITELPPEIGQLKNLTYINLSHNKLDQLPKEIFQLKNLTKLYLRYNLLNTLPKEIKYLNNLKELNLSRNQLTELPKEIAHLKKLVKLNLGHNLLKKLPKELFQLKNLSQLDLGFNQLISLPGETAQLKQLTHLGLQFNQLSELIIEIGQLKKLVYLDLRFNQLNALPGEIGQLVNVFGLNLMANNLNKLPKEIGQLKNLSELNLMANNLSKLPKEIGQLKNLSQFDVSENRLTELPEEIGHLKNLSLLNLRYNKLKKLPKKLICLRKLRHLISDENPLSFPPVEIANQGIDAVIGYLKKSEKRGQALYEGKLLIVGQGGVGKTSLMRRLIQDEYSERETTTGGIDVQLWKITAPDKPKTQMTLYVWDFGGQEIYHATHQFFLTRRSLYIFVWDARQEEEYGRIDYWLNTIETFAADSPILIIMNKSDERSKDLNLKDLKQRFPQIVASGKVSAKKGTGIEGLRNFIAKQAWKLPLMGTTWPSSWLAVRRSLEATQRFHVPYKTYLQVCKKAGIEEREAKTLSRYLHDLGIILHFHKDILLKDTIILRPEWGTDAVYKVLDAKPVQERNGILYHADLPKIWTNRTLYPPDKYAIILRLMANFELAFPFETGDRHIVAELLPPNEVEYNWNPGDCLQFEYHYEFLPAGIITRVIVRMHEFLIRREDKHLCWREGAYFEYENSQAMVRINPYTRITKIQVQGSAEREFLAIIRSHFAAIHKTIRKIRFREKIPCTCTPECEHCFDYNVLLKYEEKNRDSIVCEKSIEDVSVGKLLDGIEKAEVRRKKLFPGDFDHENSFQPLDAETLKSRPPFEDGERLAAIMFTDIVGFSKQMEKNEEKTLRLLEDHFSTMRSILAKHQGTEIKTIGDAFMVMFQSAADAVKCALEIQASHRIERDNLIPRIGIHIGDLVFKNGDIFGDGVNIAARIEPLADPGGICISEDVYNIVKKKMELETMRLENVTLKNIKAPPVIYKVIIEEELLTGNIIYLSNNQ
ncbi:COR domain-containing protein [Desulfococcaceae bacterium HSG8]|nr:COR domain-containing protein [Desulfococcaceae bacterium HSG8]